MKPLILSVALLVAAAHLAHSATWNWDLESPEGKIHNNPKIYLSSPDDIRLRITAYQTGILDVPSGARWTAPTATTSDVHIYAKTEGGDENGLGISTDPSHENEIYVNSFLQLDLRQLRRTSAIDAVTLTLGSLQGAESFDLWGSNVAGRPGKLLLTGGAAYNMVPFPVPSYGKYRYISISAGEGNLLLNAVSAKAPEPGTFGLAAIAILGLVARRRYCTE